MITAPDRLLYALGVLLAYALLCAGVAWRHRRRQAAASARLEVEVSPQAHPDPPVLVAFASQTGRAEGLARQTAHRLQAAGIPVRVRPLGELVASELQAAGRALFVVSTTGEGDAPDNASRFVRVQMPAAAGNLAPLRHAVLALGDRAYADFCGFGRRLDGWLRQNGSQPLFERIEVDDDEDTALHRWQAALQSLGPAAARAPARSAHGPASSIDNDRGAGKAAVVAEGVGPDAASAEARGEPPSLGWDTREFETWRLAERALLNAGSPGGECWRVALQPPGAAHWEAGDLVEVLPPGESRPRAYSVASLPSDGVLELIVRQARRPDGQPGAASGWLTTGTAGGKAVALRLRPHPLFRVAGNAGRPLVLIGNGSGWAGLRSHLKARAAVAGVPAPCWLVFGERTSAHDRWAAAELSAWQARGVLARVDLVFSRDTPGQPYVQHRLAHEHQRLLDWLGRGAAVYVCGSAQGMGQGVDQVLRDTLGDAAVEHLIETGRYRRDLY